MMNVETHVAILINGTKHQLEVTKKTTCSDVIKMATITPKDYEICEIHGETEKVLPRNTRLLKQIRTWGISRHEYNLELKMVADKRKSKMAKLSRAREALSRLKSILKSSDTEVPDLHEKNHQEKNHEDILNNLDNEVRTDKQYEKNITLIREINENIVDNIKPVYQGKLELMNRYLQDIRVNTVLNINVDTDNEIDEVEDNVVVDLSGVTDSDHLDDAFITQSSLTCIEESINIGDDLNECRLYDLHADDEDDDDDNEDDDDNGDDNDSVESAFEDISDCSSVCELDRNITMEELNNTLIKMNDLKAAFSDGDLNKRIVGDTLLNSFMYTIVHDNESDEGLSSLDSDIE